MTGTAGVQRGLYWGHSKGVMLGVAYTLVDTVRGTVGGTAGGTAGFALGGDSQIQWGEGEGGVVGGRGVGGCSEGNTGVIVKNRRQRTLLLLNGVCS